MVHAREWTSFWRENAIARRHSTTSFTENVVVAKISHGNVSSFIILLSGKGLTAFNRNNCANLTGEKKVK